MSECSVSTFVLFLSEQCSSIQLALLGGGAVHKWGSLSALKRSR